jgi:hypothetical protein
MPPVRTLTTAAVATPTAEKPQSALAVPAWASAPLAVPDEPLKGPRAAFVGVLQGDTGKRQALQAAGCADGDFYVDDGGAITPLKPLKFWLLQAQPFRTKMAASGDIVAASLDFHDKSAGDEHVVTLVIVDTGKALVPAKADFRRSQWQVGNDAINGVRRAASPDFPNESDAAKVAAQFPAPFGRIVITASTQRKIGRQSGKPYYEATGVATPASVTDLQRLADAMQDPDFLARVSEAEGSYKYRVEQIRSKCE